MRRGPPPRYTTTVGTLSSKKPRLLVFVIAYYAEATLKKVLERIPAAIFHDFDTQILVVDDASEDRTFEIGREYKDAHPEIRMTVLRNEYNQGYGGNQKVGYGFALDEGVDFVAMVHGDGQYAPEELPRLMQPLVRGEADAVFGSRMMTPLGALKGGMPFYKFLGNRVLTTAQNALLGSRLTEFHSGYRIYSTRALKSIHYELNSNDFHFDTEIIIELLNAQQRIVELPIPTYYGDEICRVNGMKYAKDVMVATAQNYFHRAGLLWQRRFEPKGDGNTHYDLKLGYPSSHQAALDAVPAGASVLDIGSGPGGVPRALAEKQCTVAVVDQFEPTHKEPGIQVFVQDLDEPPAFDVHPYQYILLLDVLEHLKEPELFVEQLRAQFDHTPKTLVITTPNVAFFVQRLMLLAGQFNYGKAGILDSTHRRMFTFRSMLHLLRDSGFKVKEVRGIPAPFPKVLGNGLLGKAALAVNQALIRVSKTVFAYQIYVVAEGTPDVPFLLRNAKEKSTARAAKLRAEAPERAPTAQRARGRARPTAKTSKA